MRIQITTQNDRYMVSLVGCSAWGIGTDFVSLASALSVAKAIAVAKAVEGDVVEIGLP